MQTTVGFHVGHPVMGLCTAVGDPGAGREIGSQQDKASGHRKARVRASRKLGCRDQSCLRERQIHGLQSSNDIGVLVSGQKLNQKLKVGCI